MCGINFVLNFPEEGEEAIEKMMAATLHRGPDHSAWLKVAPGIFLAGNRLKTQDLGEAGNQPIMAEDGQAFLVWNGALYNCQELRNELLGKGLVFSSQADAEVLLHWLRIYGEEGLKQLEGMFALVFVDKDKGQIIIARDSYGKKPLYYYQQGPAWLFSSEARGIIAADLVAKKLDVAQYLPYFYSRHSFPDQSFFEGVKQVLPGEALVLDLSGQLISRFRLEVKQQQVELPTIPQFREMVLDAVLKNFQADVPVGLILSGGVDSSLLLHSWYRENGQPLHTFTAAFESAYQSKYSDPRFAAIIAKEYRCAHHEVLITPDTVLQHWDEYIAALDQPIGDSAGFLTWMVAREAKLHVKILISGAGADELFSGYDRHKAFGFYLKNKKKLMFLARHGLLFWLPRRPKKLLNGIADSNEETYLNFSSLQAIPVDLRDPFLCYFPKGLSPYKAALAWDRQYYLVNDVLKIHDNATMAHGLEGRAPYMDAALVTLSNNMTEEQHLSLEAKYWMKEILREDGWGKISSRKKLGFGLPLKEWLLSDSRFSQKIFSVVKQFASSSGTDFPGDMRDLASRPEAHVKEGFLQLWNLFVLASWKEKQGL